MKLFFSITAIFFTLQVQASPCEYGRIERADEGNRTSVMPLKIPAALEAMGLHYNPDSKNIAYVSASEHERVLSALNPLYLGYEVVLNAQEVAMRKELGGKSKGWINVGKVNLREAVQLRDESQNEIATFKRKSWSMLDGWSYGNTNSDTAKWKLMSGQCE